jgi:serine/threonine-protein kinase RsbW
MTLASWQKRQTNLGDLGALRQFINQQALTRGLDDAGTYDLALAVTEAVTNIVVHGYAGRPGPVMVFIERMGDMVIVQIRDHAPPFNPSVIPSPALDIPLEQRPLGGMGFYLIRSSVNQVTYEKLPEGGNSLKLMKFVSGGSNEYDDGR